MRTTILTITLAVLSATAACSKHKPAKATAATQRARFMSAFDREAEARNLVEAIKVAVDNHLFTAVELTRRLRDVVTRIERREQGADERRCGAHESLAREWMDIAYEMQRHNIDASLTRRCALHAFDHATPESCKGLGPQADKLAEDFDLGEARHHRAIIKTYTGTQMLDDPDYVAFEQRHPLTAEIAREAYEFAMSHRYWLMACMLADHGRLGQPLLEAARRPELAEEFHDAIQRNEFGNALRIVRDPLSGKSAAEVHAVAAHAFTSQMRAFRYGAAADIVDEVPGGIPSKVVRDEAFRAYSSEMQTHRYRDAYRVARLFNLGGNFAEHARYSAVEDALRTGRFTFATHLPDGSMVIIADGS